MSIKERKELEKSEMRGLILNTAMNLFLDKGFENITIRNIAEKIDYSPATIYLYFKNKDDILFTLRKIGFEKLYEHQVSSLKFDDPLKRLHRQGKTYIKFALENPEYYDLMFIMRGAVARTLDINNCDVGLDSYELLKKNVKECMDEGLFPRTDIDVAAFALWSYVHGIASLIIRGVGIMFPEEGINDIIEGSLNFMLKFDDHKNRNKKKLDLSNKQKTTGENI
ncbi:MAG: TetR/AcrR family transcriptional regulator [Candidatus Methanoperedens sp.]|nr:TetR/AcrR family transcriptional regulator [Candidatus Methanoperedens sp.]